MIKNMPFKIRLANSAHMTAIPFNLLRGLDFIDYQENLITENARLLHEREVDLALIPSTEYALNGNYVGLDYGVACRKRSDLVMLYAKQELTKIQTVYYHQKCGSTPLLLKLLLKSRWKVFPRIIKATKNITPDDLGPTEALLLIHDHHVDRDKIKLPVAEDLIKLWYEWTGLPFVFLIWSTRPGILASEQYPKINEIFNVCDKVRECELSTLSEKYDLPFGYLTKYQPDRDFYYKLGADEHQALETFFELCSEEGLLPVTKYRSAKLSLLGRVEAQLPSKKVEDILSYVLDGHRVSIADAVKLAELAPLEDVAMAADSLRSRLYTDFSMRLSSRIDIRNTNEVMEFVQLQEQTDAHCSRVELTNYDCENFELKNFQRDLALIKNNLTNIQVAALSPTQLYRLAKINKRDLHELASEFAILGLDVLASEAADDTATKQLSIGSDQWSNVVQIAHKVGLKIDLQIKICAKQSWEDRILCLQKIRFMQDLNGSIQTFSFCVGKLDSKQIDFEDQLRLAALTRIYLDNIATIRLVANYSNLVSAATFLNFGCNAILCSRRFKSPEPNWQFEDFRTSLAVAGLRLNITL